ncbi:hypothetical protein ACFQL0_03940 [Haloplanus litoreus]|uniref:hypothetical protein n=1 Tax=Haloplanus litoreus TaxID=767515 RepID=UPI0036236535
MGRKPGYELRISDRGKGERGAEAAPAPVEAFERQLQTALESAEGEETRFHLRQALQLAKALEESRP